jgi:hypothetical protein
VQNGNGKPVQARMTGGTMNFHCTPASSSIAPLTAASRIVVPDPVRQRSNQGLLR